MYSCFHSVGLPSRSLHEAIHMVADAGYKAIELNAETLPWAQAHITPAADAVSRRAVASACKSRGLSVPAIGAHIQMVSADASQRAAAIAFVKGCADIAHDVGSPVIHILSGPLGKGVDMGQAWGWFRRAVEETTGYATKLGIQLGIEAIAGHVFHGVDDYHRLRQELPGVPFKINFDPSHLEVQQEDPMRVVKELGDQVIHMHLKDGKGSFPKFEFPPLGKGNIDFTALVDALKKAGYKGALSVEYEAQVYGYRQGESEILAEGKVFCDRLIQMSRTGAQWQRHSNSSVS
jgi:sugar phosphate isomerase/epimerase